METELLRVANTEVQADTVTVRIRIDRSRDPVLLEKVDESGGRAAPRIHARKQHRPRGFRGIYRITWLCTQLQPDEVIRIAPVPRTGPAFFTADRWDLDDMNPKAETSDAEYDAGQVRTPEPFSWEYVVELWKGASGSMVRVATQDPVIIIDPDP